MLIENLQSTDDKLKKLNSILNEEFDISLSVTDVTEAFRIYKLYENKNKHLSYVNPSISLENDTYRKNVLIMESMRIILREVAPKRTKTIKRKI